MLIDRVLADTSYMAGPDDELITDDVYTKKDDSLVNFVPKIPALDFSAANSKIADDLRGGLMKALPKSASGGIGSLLSKASGALKGGFNALGGLSGVVSLASKVAGPSLMSRLGSAGGLNGIPGLPAGLSSTLTNVLKQAPGGLNGMLNGAIPNQLGAFAKNANGSLTRLVPGNITSAFGVSNIINSLTGGTGGGIFDKDATARMISGVAIAGAQSGLSSVFSSLSPMAGIAGDVIFKAAGPVIAQAAAKGNIPILKDVASVIGGKSVFSMNPNALQKTMANYRLPPNATAAQMATEFSETKSTFGSINPNWAKSGTAIDLSGMQNGSPDFLKMVTNGALNSNVPEEKFFALAGAFPSVSPEKSLSKSFPKTPTSLVANSGFTSYAGMSDKEFADAVYGPKSIGS